MKKRIKEIINNKKYSKIKVSIIMILFLFIISLSTFCFSFFFTTGGFSGSKEVIIPAFDPRVNSSSSNSQSISLADTITNNKSLSPGAEGKFKIDIDFTDVSTNSYYKVYYDRTGLPNNLKFYVDEDYTTEFDNLEGVEYKDNSDRTSEHYVYWKWIVDNSASSNANDSLYMGQDIGVDFTAHISQMVEKNTIIANGVEKPTGRINIASTHSGNNKGAFNFNLDFSNVSANTQYRIYFNEKELSSNLHLYSDSSYQTELNYIQGTYDGNNTQVTNTIYWELETGNINTLSNGLYYVVVFGSW